MLKLLQTEFQSDQIYLRNLILIHMNFENFFILNIHHKVNYNILHCLFKNLTIKSIKKNY